MEKEHNNTAIDSIFGLSKVVDPYATKANPTIDTYMTDMLRNDEQIDGFTTHAIKVVDPYAIGTTDSSKSMKEVECFVENGLYHNQRVKKAEEHDPESD